MFADDPAYGSVSYNAELVLARSYCLLLSPYLFFISFLYLGLFVLEMVH